MIMGILSNFINILESTTSNENSFLVMLKNVQKKKII